MRAACAAQLFFLIQPIISVHYLFTPLPLLAPPTSLKIQYFVQYSKSVDFVKMSNTVLTSWMYANGRNEMYLQNIREYGHAMMSAATAIWSSWSTWHVNRGIKATNSNTQDRVNRSRRGLCTWVKEWEKGNRLLNIYRTTSIKVINFLIIRQGMIWLAKWCKIQENCIYPHSPIYWLTYIHDLLSRSRT